MTVGRSGTSHLLGNRWSLKPLVQRSFEPLIRIYVYLLVLLPSGSLFGINVKMICFCLLLIPAFIHLTDDREVEPAELGLFISVPALFALWVFVAQFYGFPLIQTFFEYRDILITFLSCWLAAVYFMNDSFARIKFVRTVMHAEMAACVLKALLLAYSVSAGVSVAALVDSINTFFGVSLMGMDFESALGRIQFTSDGLIPLCIFVLLRYRRRVGFSIGGSSVMLLLLTVSLVFTFSRYFWGFGLAGFAAGMIFGKKDRFHAILVVMLGLVVAASFPMLASLATLRFSADVASGSDQARVNQSSALVKYFESAPILGHGLGSHPNALIRSQDAPYAYEIQIYALAGQIGLAGLGLMVLLIAYYYRSLWRWDGAGLRRSLSQRAGIGALLVFCLMGGMFNPILLNSAAAMSYALLKALAELPEDRGKEDAYPSAVSMASLRP